MPHDVFISYRDAANDKAEAERVCGHLEAEGFSCWIAPRDVLQGDDFGAAIVNAIQDCSVLVLIFSAAANSSRQIARELKLADDAKKTVLPIRIENVMPTGNCAYFLGAAQWLDAFGGIREEHLRRLASGLRTRLGTEPKILTRVNPADGLTYVFIPPGKFVMGCSPDDSERFDDEKPPHPEQIMNGFWLGQTPVTQAAWVKVMGGNASHFKGDRLPVENVDWTQAGDYCKAIGGRLPTEMEWEYAVRAGTTGGRYGLLDDVAGIGTTAVGRHIRWVSSRQMLSAFMTCWGTFGNGYLTNMRLGMRWCAGVPGATSPGSSGLRTVAGASQRDETSTWGSGVWGNSVKVA